ncbi:hypothetical protein RMN57_03595 [Kitasatospora sp. CM 4170]|uniref:Secreted protein n=1 Tax=Kitasatospora aburaviensis TaxID=67265 RepID=A0ABW1EZ97_9ACTN|nr:hypothetical protein [Kitasatospora sp. CM 4170]WNM43852.1 hypothetical protein RMN57_03595 [Kitasatospora sp. CM 4170]
MTWLRVLTALGILAVAASALLVFALCTAAARGDRTARDDGGEGAEEEGGRGRGGPPDTLRDDAERSGLFRRPGES